MKPTKQIAGAAECAENHQYSTFYLGKRWYGIDVKQVQEVTKSLAITPIPLAPAYVRGLINLRGQIATAVTLQGLFGDASERKGDPMNVVCRIEGMLLALLVDQIGDVVELPADQFEPPPTTIEPSVRRFLRGVYKTSGNLLSVIALEDVSQVLNANE